MWNTKCFFGDYFLLDPWEFTVEFFYTLKAILNQKKKKLARVRRPWIIQLFFASITKDDFPRSGFWILNFHPLDFSPKSTKVQSNNQWHHFLFGNRKNYYRFMITKDQKMREVSSSNWQEEENWVKFHWKMLFFGKFYFFFGLFHWEGNLVWWNVEMFHKISNISLVLGRFRDASKLMSHE